MSLTIDEMHVTDTGTSRLIKTAELLHRNSENFSVIVEVKAAIQKSWIRREVLQSRIYFSFPKLIKLEFY
jgi:hypothetical protein